jgi:hypothetical protein
MKTIETILYWILFGAVVIAWAVWAFVVLFGGGPLGYTRNSTESTPTRKDGNH